MKNKNNNLCLIGEVNDDKQKDNKKKKEYNNLMLILNELFYYNEIIEEEEKDGDRFKNLRNKYINQFYNIVYKKLFNMKRSEYMKKYNFQFYKDIVFEEEDEKRYIQLITDIVNFISSHKRTFAKYNIKTIYFMTRDKFLFDKDFIEDKAI